jgi:hypothetical protein
MVCRTARRVPPPPPAQEAEWLFGIPAADALAHPERVLEQGSWRGVLVSGGPRGLCTALGARLTRRQRGGPPPATVHCCKPPSCPPRPRVVPWRAEPPPRSLPRAAGEKGSGYAFHAPGGKLALSGVVPVLSVDVADTTGAGDAFLAGFLFYMLMAGGLDSLVADPGKVGPARQRGGWARYPRSGVGEEVGGRQFGMATCRAGRGARPLAASVRRPSTIATSIQLAAQPNSAGRGAALAELVRLPGT